MDPLTHSLVGLALAATPLGRRSRFATAALVAGANLPDVDALAYVFASPDFALYCRRGWTHGVLALAVLPLVLTGVLLAADRIRPPGTGQARAAAPALLALAALAVATHPVLDWLNTYGVRLFLPFDGRWFYGDALFIVDPWVWLLLGGAAFLARRRDRRATMRWAALAVLALGFVLLTGRAIPWTARVLWLLGLLLVPAFDRRGERDRPRLAAASLAAFAAYAGCLIGLSRLTEQGVRTRLGMDGGEPIESVLAAPLPANPFSWDIVVAREAAYRFYRFDWLGRRAPVESGPPIARGPLTPVVRAARGARAVRGMVNWARFPWYEVETTAGGYRVWIRDARYSRTRGTGFGAARVDLDRDLVPLAAPGGLAVR